MWQKEEVDTFTNYILYTSLVQAPSDETLNILAQCDQYMNVQGVKAIMVNDEAEFDAAREEAMTELNAMGFEKAREEILSLYEAAKTDASSFEIK